MSREEAVSRANAFLQGVRTSVECGNDLAWLMLEEKLQGLMISCFQDGQSFGAELNKIKVNEQKILTDALDRLLAMGAERRDDRALEIRGQILETVKEDIVAVFNSVVEEYFDPSGRKLKKVTEKFAERIDAMTSPPEPKMIDGTSQGPLR